ncbi:MAG: FGGY family carbohydrate kinase, partial [Victivallales bacterium]|nr:FGGY family carbohydrate kinase [Victivallales bacterium]
MSKELLIGIDFGTGSCKVTVTDTAGNILTAGSREYPTSHPRPGWAEQQPNDWYTAMCAVLRELKPMQYGKVIAAAADSYTHGAVLLDDKLRVIRPTIIWTDQRSAGECEYLKKNYFDLIFNTACQAPTPTWTLPQMLWLKNNEPETLRKAKYISFVKDYIRFRLTGELACDSIESQGTLFWDMKNGCWSRELCELGGIPFAALPKIKNPLDIGGKITAQAATDTGLPEGTPLVMGASDSAIEDYAAGAIEPGQCILKLATAGNVNVMTAEAHPHPETLTYSHVIPGMWYTVTATNAAAVCQRWFRDTCCAAGTDYNTLNELAAQSPPGANGVFFHPYLMGERSPYWDPNLRGSFTGMSMATSKGDLNRALLEGVAFSLKDCFRTIEKMGLQAYEFILIGGGAKSKLWSRIVCDVFNAPVKLPAACDASFGSALLAGVGLGVFSDAKSAVQQCHKLRGELLPEAENAAFY